MLEENISVLVRAAHYGMLGVESALSERLNSVHVAHLLEVLVVPDLDLLYLVRGTEAVEEVDEGNASLDCREMSNGAEIHDLLRVGLGKHCETCLTASVDVGVIAEDVERVRRDASCGYMENCGKQLAGDLIHVGDHKKQTLGSGVGGCERTCGQRTVNGSGGACLGLHFGNLDGRAENIFHALCRPLINIVSHGARRGYRVDTGNLCERVRHICSSIIAVHALCYSCHSMFLPILINV